MTHPLSVNRRAVTVTAVDTATSTATVQWADGVTVTAGVPYLASYGPRPGDVASLDLVAGSPLLVGTAMPGRTGCRLRRVANQSVANNTAGVALAWDTEDQDTHGYITVTGTTVTIPVGLGGLYSITCRAAGGFSAALRAYIQIVPTSAVAGFPADLRVNQPSAENRLLVSVADVPLLDGDSFTVEVFHNQGAAVLTTAWLTCYRTGR